jgi:hypothetical protein
MLRIPGPGDQPPPLVVPLKGSSGGEDGDAAGRDRRKDNHRRKRSRKGEGHAWDHRSRGGQRVSQRQEKRQMFWMLIGGATLFALIVAGVWVAMFGGDVGRDGPAVSVVGTHPPIGGDAGIENAAAADGAEPAPPWNQQAFLTAAESLASRFLSVRTVDDLLPLVREPERAEARIRSHYAGGVVEMPGMAEFNTQRQVERNGSLLKVGLRTGDFEDREMTFVEDAGGLRIDWESWVGWSEMTWEAFMEAKPTEPQLFRVILSAIDYYNFGFSNEGKWQSFRLESLDSAHAVYGYAERGSVLEARLRPPADQIKIPLVLALKFPEDPRSSSQVLIERFIAEGWGLENEDK